MIRVARACFFWFKVLCAKLEWNGTGKEKERNHGKKHTRCFFVLKCKVSMATAQMYTWSGWALAIENILSRKQIQTKWSEEKNPRSFKQLAIAKIVMIFMLSNVFQKKKKRGKKLERSNSIHHQSRMPSSLTLLSHIFFTLCDWLICYTVVHTPQPTSTKRDKNLRGRQQKRIIDFFSPASRCN